jgi:hypothetical protein
MGFWRTIYYYMGWDYYDHWEQRQKDLKYTLHKQIINTDMTKLLKSIKEPEEKYLSKSINYSKGHYLHTNNKNEQLIVELKNKISSNNNNNEKSNNGNLNKANGGSRKRTNKRKRQKKTSY